MRNRPGTLFAAFIAISYSTLFMTYAWAAAGGKTNLGLQLGVGMPGKVSPVVVLGAEGNVGIGDRLSVGPFYYKYSSTLTIDSDGTDAVSTAATPTSGTTSSDSSTSGTTNTPTGITTLVTSEVSTTFLGAEASYALPTLMQGFAAGLRIGKGTTTTTLTATQDTSTITLTEETSGIMLAPRVLLDKPVSASLSVGGEISYWYGLNSGMPRGFFILFPVRYLF